MRALRDQKETRDAMRLGDDDDDDDDVGLAATGLPDYGFVALGFVHFEKFPKV